MDDSRFGRYGYGSTGVHAARMKKLDLFRFVATKNRLWSKESIWCGVVVTKSVYESRAAIMVRQKR